MLSQHTPLQVKFKTAMHQARVTCALGASNKNDDFVRTNGWSTLAYYLTFMPGGYLRNVSHNKVTKNIVNPFSRKKHFDLVPAVNFDKNCHPSNSERHWFYFPHQYLSKQESWKGVKAIDANHNPISKLPENQQETILDCMHAQIARQGTCRHYAAIIFMYLWRHSEGINRIEIFTLLDDDHTYVVVNRNGNSNDPSTWGDAWIVDGWAENGKIYHASDYTMEMERTKEYLKLNIKQLCASMNIAISIAEKQTNQVFVEVLPAIQPYPSDDKYKSVFDYYDVTDGRFMPLLRFNQIERVKVAHQKRMHSVLTQISLFKTDINLKPSTMTQQLPTPGQSH
jgi:hypothetical protein